MNFFKTFLYFSIVHAHFFKIISFYFFLIFLLLLQHVRETYYLDLVHFLATKENIFSHSPMHMREKLITLTFKHVHTLSFSNSNTSIVLLDKEKVDLYYVGLPFRQKWKLTIHIIMVDHRSTSLPE